MKYLSAFLLVLSAFCIVFSAKAQVVISTDDLPQLGTFHQIKQQNLPPDVSLGTASPTAQTWDFTALGGDLKTVEFIDPSLTPAEDAFPDAEMARQGDLLSLLGINIGDNILVNVANGTAYYSTTSSGKIYAHGLSAQIGVPGVLDLGMQNLVADPEDLYLAPMSYGQTQTSNGTFSQSITVDIDTIPFPVDIIFSIRLEKTVTADAFGTVQMPNNVNYEVLRYNESVNVRILVSGGVFGIPLFTLLDQSFPAQVYRFMARGEDFPVASFNMNATGIGPSITFVEYLHALSNGTGNAPTANVTLQAFPNPSSSSIRFSYPDDNAHQVANIAVYDTHGRLMHCASAQAFATDVNVSQWQCGLYYGVLQDDKGNVLARKKISKY